MNLVAVLIAIAVVLAVVHLLDANHRRTASLDRSPFGLDLETDRDHVRLEHDLDAARAHDWVSSQRAA